MELRDWIFIIFLLVLWLFLNLLGNLTLFDLIYAQFIFAIVIYLVYRSNSALFLGLVILFFADASLGINLAFSILSFTVVGFLLSILNRIYPLFKQQPFVQARVLWLFGCIIVYTLLKSSLEIGDVMGGLFGSILINTLLLLILTFLIEPFFGRRTGKDIVIE
jgi:hypothetical protein